MVQILKWNAQKFIKQKKINEKLKKKSHKANAIFSCFSDEYQKHKRETLQNTHKALQWIHLFLESYFENPKGGLWI